MTRVYKIGVLAGDGIGPEVIGACLKVLDVAQERFGFHLELYYGDAGANCISRYQTQLPKTTFTLLQEMDACLKASISCAQGHVSVSEILRKKFDLFSSVYFFHSFPHVALLSGINFLLVQERSEGLSGLEQKKGQRAVASRVITGKGTKNSTLTALEYSLERKNRLAILHKKDILPLSDGFFLETALRTAKKYRKISATSFSVDSFCRELFKNSVQFDVVLAENFTASIIAAQVTALVGGVGMVPVCHFGKNYALFETVHGTAAKYTNMNKVNPLAMILAGVMMLNYLGEHKAANSIIQAVHLVLNEGRFKTYDIGGISSTNQLAQPIASTLLHLELKK